MRAVCTHTDPGRPEETLRGQHSHFVIKQFGVGGVWVEVIQAELEAEHRKERLKVVKGKRLQS